MESSSSILSQYAPTDGFDTVCGQTWVYPTNKPVREYQFNITKEALFKNTMVCLPTGLGKTFIAAVVMYNYFRWYPQGKIIFMASTRPLVKQQVDACYDIVAIPKEVTAELTGSNAQSSRENIWDEKRVFFITPQVLQNDIEKITQLGKQIKCLVFDEAHRARGNHAYCEVMRKIFAVNKFFRVLGLSATPGSTVVDVVKVCNDLLIAHLEMRTEESPDVSPYVFKRTINTVVVPLSQKLTQVINDYTKVLDQYVRVLMKHRVVNENASTLTKGRLFYVMKEYQQKPLRGAAHNEIMKALNICLVLYHAFEVLTKHGLRGFLKFFEEHLNKPLLKGNVGIINIMTDVDRYMGPIPIVDVLPDGTVPEVPKNTVFGHPKFYKLSELIVNHYKQKGENSKVIVFCEYRESVLEAYTILLMQRPLIRPGMFLGQAAITQKQQLNIMNNFRNGICNTLISTSIGEEGLDVGEVDLVICFDISNKSSIRIIQRIGRTGRKRDGSVIMLATEGKEYKLLKESLNQKDNTTNTIMNSRELVRELYKNNPRMVPPDINPTCNKMFITVTKAKQKLKNNDLKSMFSNMATGSDQELLNIEVKEFNDYLPSTHLLVTSDCPMDSIQDTNKMNMSSKLVKQRVLQSSFGQIGSSLDSEMFVSLLQLADSKRYNIPLTQVSNKPSTKTGKNDGFKQSDIRTMFLQSQLPPPTQETPVVIIPENNLKYHKETFNELQQELTNYLSTNSIENDTCHICKHLFPCEIFNIKSDLFKVSDWIAPEMSIIDSIDIISLNSFIDEIVVSELNEIGDDLEGSDFDISDNEVLSPNLSKSLDINADLSPVLSKSLDINADLSPVLSKSLKFNNDEHDLDLEMQGVVASSVKRKTFFQMPKSAKKILENLRKDPDDFIIPESYDTKLPTNCKNSSELSDEDIFDDIQIFEDLANLNKTVLETKNKSDSETKTKSDLVTKNISTLDFFKLNELDELFVTNKADVSEDDLDKTILWDHNIEQPESPVMNLVTGEFESPSICQSDEVFDRKNNRASKRLFTEMEEDNEIISINELNKEKQLTPVRNLSKKSKPNLSTLRKARIGFYDPASSSRNDKPVSKNQLQTPKKLFLSDNEASTSKQEAYTKISDSTKTCEPTITTSSKKQSNTTIQKNLDYDDVFGDFFMDMVDKPKKKNSGSSDLFDNKSSEELFEESFIPKSKQNLSLNDVCNMSFLDSQGDKSKKSSIKSSTTELSDIFEESFLKDITTHNENIKKPTSSNWKNSQKFVDSIFEDSFDDGNNSNCSSQKNVELNDIIDASFLMDLPINNDIKNKTLSQCDKTSIDKDVENKTFSQHSKSSIDKDIKNKTLSQHNKSSISKDIKTPSKDKASISGRSNRKKYLNDSKKSFNSEPLKSPILSQKYKIIAQSSSRSSQNKKSIKFDDIFDDSFLKDLPINDKNKSKSNSQQNIKLNDIIDDSFLMDLPNKNETKSKSKINKNIELDDIIDTSFLMDTTIKDVKNKTHSQNSCKEISKTTTTNKEYIDGYDDFCDESIQELLWQTRKCNSNKPESPKSPVIKSQKRKSQYLDDSFENYISQRKKSQKTESSQSKVNISDIMNKYRIESPIKMSHKTNEPTKSRDLSSSASSSSEFISPKKQNKSQFNSTPIFIDSEDEFEESPVKKRPIKKRTKKVTTNPFLDMEAGVSTDASVSADEISGSSQDLLESSFVNDETQILETTNMQAHYMQSVRSPPAMSRKFKIPALPIRINQSIFSQAVVDDGENTYMNDSFCVDTETIDLTQHDMSELEIAEMLLKEQRRKKKKDKEKATKVKNQRRRILVLSDSD